MRFLALLGGLILVHLLGLLGFEPEHQEQSVQHERRGHCQDGVHEKVQLHMLEPVLLQPLKDVVFG